MSQSGLEKRLDYLLLELYNHALLYGNLKTFNNIKSSDAIHDTTADILTAIKDAGYIQTLKLNNRTIVANGKDPLGYIVYYPDEVMTGAEWLARFEKELYVPEKQDPSIKHDDDGESHDRFYRAGGANFMYRKALEAAKRASGVE